MIYVYIVTRNKAGRRYMKILILVVSEWECFGGILIKFDFVCLYVQTFIMNVIVKIIKI